MYWTGAEGLQDEQYNELYNIIVHHEHLRTIAEHLVQCSEHMVPIVEPEVLMDGSHDINKCYQVTTDVLNECYNELANQRVDLKGTVLKPNMIIPASDSKKK